jgi:hypothetical protein
MKLILKIEEALMTAVALYALSFHSLGLSAWVWVILFFLVDLSMLGYLANARIGAVIYNIFHHKGFALIILSIGYFIQSELLLATGLVLFAHASFDRIWGYGLKFETGFKDTHLGSSNQKRMAPTEA